jgi:hypothetical protein
MLAMNLKNECGTHIAAEDQAPAIDGRTQSPREKVRRVSTLGIEAEVPGIRVKQGWKKADKYASTTIAVTEQQGRARG